MKKFLSLILAVVLALSATLALAEAPAADKNSVLIKLNVDNDATKNVMAKMFGMPEEQIKGIEPFLPLLGALGMRATRDEGGVQIDLVLGDKDAVSFAVEPTDKEYNMASSLFPNYILTVDENTLKQISPSDDPEAKAAANEAMAGYVMKYVQSVTAAMKPGEAEKGTFEFEGITFDTHMPMTMDSAAMCEAVKTFMAEALNDKRVTSMFQAIPNFNPQEVLAEIDKMTADNFPDVTVDVYLLEGQSEPFYFESKSTYKGEQKGMTVDVRMLAKSAAEGTMKISMPEMKMDINVEYSENRVYVEFAKGEKWIAFDGIKVSEDEVRVDLYAVEKDKPFASIDITVSAGARTLSASAEGKTVLSIKDLMGGENSEAVGGLLSDVMANGMGGVMQAINEVAPDAGAMIGQLFAPQQAPQQ